MTSPELDPDAIMMYCTECKQQLTKGNLQKGPSDKWAHGVYYGADWGHWCVFRVRPEEEQALRRLL